MVQLGKHNFVLFFNSKVSQIYFAAVQKQAQKVRYFKKWCQYQNWCSPYVKPQGLTCRSWCKIVCLPTGNPQPQVVITQTYRKNENTEQKYVH